MTNKIYYTIAFCFFLAHHSFAQQTSLYNYKDGDNQLRRFLSRDLVRNSEGLNDFCSSAVIFCEVSVSASGIVDSINTWNDSASEFSKVVLSSVARTKASWVPTGRRYRVIIPVYFVFNSDWFNQDTGRTDIRYKDFVPINLQRLAGGGIIMEPLLISIGAKMHTRVSKDKSDRQ